MFADELSESGIQEGVEAGHTYVKPFGQTGPDVRLEGTEDGMPTPPAIIGDTLPSATGFGVTFTARVLSLQQAQAARPGSYYLAVYRGTEAVLTVAIPPSADEFELSFPSLGYARYRLQVQREGAIEALSSPIYVEPDTGSPPPPPTDCEDAPLVRLTSGDERFDGTPGPDRVAGKGGSDRLRGGEGDDCLSGGRGQDRIAGGPGEDFLRGGGGSDRIRAADGEPDEILCGAGRKDRAKLDAGIDTAQACEVAKATRRSRPAAPTSG